LLCGGLSLLRGRNRETSPLSRNSFRFLILLPPDKGE
jgi:hypothetical protein